MTEPVLREPEQIRQDCAAKLRPIETSGMVFSEHLSSRRDNMFTAILGCLLNEDWAEPRIEQLLLTDKCLLARTEDQVTHKLFLGAEEDLIRNVHGIAKTAGLDGDELGYVLAAIAKIKRVE